LPQDVRRGEATTVSGDHDVTDGGLGPLGHSKDEPTRPQSKVLVGALEPWGRPWATKVRSGERADEGLSLPIIKRIEAGLPTGGRLCVGACKRRAFATRAYVAGRQPWSWAPLPLTGVTAEAMAQWLNEGSAQDRDGALRHIMRVHHRGAEGLVAEGEEWERPCGLEASAAPWSARGLGVRAPVQAEPQAVGLDKRLGHAEQKRAALTPARGRGKRQRPDEATLVEAMARGLKEPRVEGVRTMAWERQVEQHPHAVGRGRGAAKRAQLLREHSRYHITRMAREADKIAALTARCGWKALVTNAAQQRWSLADAVLCSRNAYWIERIFHRLKSRVPIAPLLVTRDDQIEGLTSLLTVGVRVLTVRELVLRRSRQNDQAHRPGLHPENGQKMTDTPTAERILKAFPDVSLTILKTAAGEEILRWLTPLSALQQAILYRRGLATSLDRQLEMQNSGN
jgi:transposase